jgi:hypothetical protein
MILAALGALVLVVLLVGLVLRNREPSSPPGRTAVQLSDREPRRQARTDIYTQSPRRGSREHGQRSTDGAVTGPPTATTPGPSAADADSTASLARGDGDSTPTLAVDGAGTTDSLAMEPPVTGSVVVMGSVFDGERPASGAILQLQLQAGGDTKTATTSDGGMYQFTPVAPGAYTVYVQFGRKRTDKPVVLEEGQKRVRVDFNLEDISEGGEGAPIRGIVVRKQDGTPIADVSVQLSGSEGGVATTSSTGEFELLAPTDGSYTVSARAGFHLPGEASVTVTDGKAEPDYVRIELSSTGAIRVQVLTPAGIPVPGALVSLFGSAAFNDPLERFGSWQTRADGIAEVNVTSPTAASSFRIGAYKEGYVPGWSEELSTSGAFGNATIRVSLAGGGSLRGRVVDSETVPIEGADITVKDGFRTTGVIYQRMNAQFPSASTGADGVFTVGPVEPGAVALGFGAEGYVSDVRNFNLTGPVLDVGDIKLESSDEDSKERVFGVIVDEGGAPMVSHNVYMKNAVGAEQFYSRTDSRGGFKMDKVPEGEYIIYTNGSALRDGIYITVDQVYPFAKPGEGSLYLVYDLAQSVRFTVSDSGGNAVTAYRAGVAIRYRGSVGFGGKAEEFGLAYEKQITDPSGAGTLTHLIAGEANLTIQAEGLGSKKLENISIGVGQQVDLGEIRLDSGSRVVGTVVASESDAPLPGVSVKAVPPYGSPATHPLYALSLKAQTDSAGQFQFNNVPEGAATLVFSRSGRGNVELGITVQAGEQADAGQVAMALSARLRGQVKDETGAILPDILIVVNTQNVFTDRDGRYFFDTLTPGEVTVLAQDRTGRFMEGNQTVSLEAGKELVADFVMKAQLPQ